MLNLLITALTGAPDAMRTTRQTPGEAEQSFGSVFGGHDREPADAASNHALPENATAGDADERSSPNRPDPDEATSADGDHADTTGDPDADGRFAAETDPDANWTNRQDPWDELTMLPSVDRPVVRNRTSAESRGLSETERFVARAREADVADEGRPGPERAESEQQRRSEPSAAVTDRMTAVPGEQATEDRLRLAPSVIENRGIEPVPGERAVLQSAGQTPVQHVGAAPADTRGLATKPRWSDAQEPQGTGPAFGTPHPRRASATAGNVSEVRSLLPDQGPPQALRLRDMERRVVSGTHPDHARTTQTRVPGAELSRTWAQPVALPGMESISEVRSGEYRQPGPAPLQPDRAPVVSVPDTPPRHSGQSVPFIQGPREQPPLDVRDVSGAQVARRPEVSPAPEIPALKTSSRDVRPNPPNARETRVLATPVPAVSRALPPAFEPQVKPVVPRADANLHRSMPEPARTLGGPLLANATAAAPQPTTGGDRHVQGSDRTAAVLRNPAEARILATATPSREGRPVGETAAHGAAPAPQAARDAGRSTAIPRDVEVRFKQVSEPVADARQAQTVDALQDMDAPPAPFRRQGAIPAIAPDRQPTAQPDMLTGPGKPADTRNAQALKAEPGPDALVPPLRRQTLIPRDPKSGPKPDMSAGQHKPTPHRPARPVKYAPTDLATRHGDVAQGDQPQKLVAKQGHFDAAVRSDGQDRSRLVLPTGPSIDPEEPDLRHNTTASGRRIGTGSGQANIPTPGAQGDSFRNSVPGTLMPEPANEISRRGVGRLSDESYNTPRITARSAARPSIAARDMAVAETTGRQDASQGTADLAATSGSKNIDAGQGMRRPYLNLPGQSLAPLTRSHDGQGLAVHPKQPRDGVAAGLPDDGSKAPVPAPERPVAFASARRPIETAPGAQPDPADAPNRRPESNDLRIARSGPVETVAQGRHPDPATDSRYLSAAGDRPRPGTDVFITESRAGSDRGAPAEGRRMDIAGGEKQPSGRDAVRVTSHAPVDGQAHRRLADVMPGLPQNQAADRRPEDWRDAVANADQRADVRNVSAQPPSRPGLTASTSPAAIKPVVPERRTEKGGEEGDPLPLRAGTDGATLTPASKGHAVPAQARNDAAAIARQIAASLPTPVEGQFEISLNPEELGRVKLQITHGEQGISVHVQAERPETLDLLRRHIDILGRDLARAGLDASGFTFGDGHQGARQTSTDGTTADTTGNIETAATEVADAPRRTRPSDGLDIRI